MVDRIVIVVRTLIERIFPRGALVLSVLSLAYFAMGIVRNRIFANTYGAGLELDAYNAAFRIPEIIFDVVVASGLTAPFVPLFLGLREGTTDDEPANDFGRTVLTAVVAGDGGGQCSDLHRGTMDRHGRGRRLRPAHA